jgi:hypothetical protein
MTRIATSVLRVNRFLYIHGVAQKKITSTELKLRPVLPVQSNLNALTAKVNGIFSDLFTKKFSTKPKIIARRKSNIRRCENEECGLKHYLVKPSNSTD